MTISNVHSRLNGGLLEFFDPTSGTTIISFDGPNLAVALPGSVTLTVAGVAINGSTLAVTGLTATATELNKLAGVTAGTVTASKALVVDSGSKLDALTVTTLEATTLTHHAVALSRLKWVDVTVTAALLDSAGTVNVIGAVSGDQYKIRNIRLVGGGVNYGAGGDRAISLTDGTTVWTTIATGDIKAAPSATLDWGNAKVAFLTGTSDTASVSNQAIRFVYSGGTTDHSATGSIKFSVCLEKVV